MKALITKSKLMNLYKFNASSPYDIGRNDLIMEILNPKKSKERLHKVEALLIPSKLSELVSCMAVGEKLACVKLLKETTGLGLKESKDLYENFELYSFQTKKYPIKGLPILTGTGINIEYA